MNFLDATMSIKDGKFWPYRKPNDFTKYVHTQSNHPHHVIKQIPNSINKRLSEISCDKEHFDRAKEPYEIALRDSGYVTKLNFQKKDETTEKPKRKRQRKIIWYNPPFNSQVKTNFGKEFLKILDSNFPKNHYLHKHLNRRTVKISYSCTKNMEAIIAAHNKNILNTNQTSARDCNCRDKNSCPMEGKCCERTLIYKAEIDIGGQKKNYIGCTEGEFKTRYNGHKDSFKNEKKKASTTLSSIVWANNKNPSPQISWSILKKTHKYQAGSRICDLCVTEKVFILKAGKDRNNINKRNEIASLCVHRNKYKLANLEDQ